MNMESSAVERGVVAICRAVLWGSTVVIFLIWLSRNVNALFFGGALATEVELALQTRRPRP